MSPLCYTFNMKYTFYCKKCDKTVQKELKISEYDEYDRKCEECGEQMERVYEAPQFKGESGGGDDISGSSCAGGSCATCPGCS